MSRELKKAYTFEEQVALLEERNMLIDDPDAAIAALQNLNYYRFTGYSYLFQKANDKYRGNTHFEAILKIMEFDGELRRILMAALEQIELRMRTQIAYWFSHNHDRDGGAYYNAELFEDPEYHAQFIENLEQQIKRNKKQLFVEHHIEEYDGKMPLWCAVEILSFSTLSKLYSNMRKEDKERIAIAQNMDPDYLANWLHCFSVLRNACAHYARLYYTPCSPAIKLGPKTLRQYPDISADSLFAYVIGILRLLPRDSDREKLQSELTELLRRYKDYVDVSKIGFPESWDKMLYDQKLICLTPVRSIAQGKEE